MSWVLDRFDLGEVGMAVDGELCFYATQAGGRSAQAQFAVYLPHPAQQDVSAFRQTWLDDCDATAGLSVTGLCPLLAHGEHRALAWRAAPWLGGLPLGILLRRMGVRSTRPPPGAALELASLLGRIARRLHEAGLAHGAIGPEQIAVLADGGFVLNGLPRRLLRDQERVRTDLQIREPAWIAPEHLSLGHSTETTDVYLVALLVLSLIRGGNPLKVGSRRRILDKVRAGLDDTAFTDVPEAIRTQLRYCLSVHPQGRPDSTRPLVDALEKCVRHRASRSEWSRYVMDALMITEPVGDVIAAQRAISLGNELRSRLIDPEPESRPEAESGPVHDDQAPLRELPAMRLPEAGPEDPPSQPSFFLPSPSGNPEAAPVGQTIVPLPEPPPLAVPRPDSLPSVLHPSVPPP